MAAPLIHGRRRRESRYSVMSEINVTPFVDVMLVLLIVFMVTAPLLSVGVTVDLPEGEAGPLAGAEAPLTISVAADGKVFLQETEIPLDELVAKLVAIAGERRDQARIFVRGDAAINYGRVMDVMSRVNAAGFLRVALVTRVPAGIEQ